ncbi:hypothetical protein [Planosporangium mesophilum]|uniref:Glycosyl transferase n=1 Tax=Planosporangium mesophilum TaxID=689768 RepID=A0A8J3X311_9ACTN|nr:hypothetical protein [Planosporangium mesophilum]NJC82520.1 hypothetical protein [Planosporangium mesophilum]GII25476.1 glycosyl transferase [Planosporangium mesophilum]
MTTEPATLVGGRRDGARAPSPAAGSASTAVADTRRRDWFAAAAYLLMAFGVTARLWLHPTGAILRENQQDQIQFEWMLTNAVHTVRHLADPFFTDLLNAPFGVNLMANTSTWGLALPLAPMTALFGAPVSFRIMLTGAFFGTALGWYHVLSRRVVSSRVAAFVGGAFCAFAPGMLGQGTGHPNVVAQFVLPFIVLVVLGMRQPARSPVRTGLLLAGLVTYQIFINEEVLLLAALALGTFVLVYWAQRPDVIRPVLRNALLSLALTTGVVSVVIAYPLYRQFLGRQSYHGLPDWVLDYNTDLASYVSYAQQSLAGSAASADHLAQGVAEQNTFYGWGLTVLVVMIVGWLWRQAAVRALAVTGAVFVLLSLGRHVVVDGDKTTVVGPWDPLSKLPLLDTVVPTRLSLVAVPIVGVLLALFVQRLMIDGAPTREAGEGSTQAPAGGFVDAARRFWTPLRVLGIGALVVAILPIAPTPLTVADRQPTPRFFATGAWRDHIRGGDTVGILPFGWNSDLRTMRWQTQQGLSFKVLGGYFLGPDSRRDDKQAAFGTGASFARTVFAESRDSPTVLSEQERSYCLRELRDWHTSVLLLPQDAPNAAVLHDAAEQIFGPGQHIEDTWVWRVP